MPTIRELLSQEPKSVDNDISALFGTYFEHVPEITPEEHGYAAWDVKSDRIEIVTFFHNNWDHRRFQSLFGVRLDGEWVMVCQNAGREGDDWYRRYIVNGGAFQEMVKHLKMLFAKRNGIDEVKVTGLDSDIADLYEFYGKDVREKYARYSDS